MKKNFKRLQLTSAITSCQSNASSKTLRQSLNNKPNQRNQDKRAKGMASIRMYQTKTKRPVVKRFFKRKTSKVPKRTPSSTVEEPTRQVQFPDRTDNSLPIMSHKPQNRTIKPKPVEWPTARSVKAQTDADQSLKVPWWSNRRRSSSEIWGREFEWN